MQEVPEPILRVLADVVAPLVALDGGELWVVGASATGLRLHLAGKCAGCPGIRTTTVDVIEPALRAAGLRGELDVSSGWTIPEGAERLHPSG